MPKLVITNSVGRNGVNNPADVIKVKTRLIELGFDWLTPNESVGQLTITTIRLFQAIKNGSDTVEPGTDGLVDVGQSTHRWLEAANAPRWQMMPAGSTAEGFINDEIANTGDTHDFGTNWLADTLRAAGASYRDEYLNDHPGAALLRINDTSLPRGGNTPNHAGHETGLVCDIRLPKTDGGVGGITVSSSNYDRDAMRAILKALKNQALADVILLNDATLRSEGLCRFAAGHDNHVHFEIKPPVRVADTGPSAGGKTGTIVIDPGHGGTAVVGGSQPNNATGNPSGVKEKTITLNMAFLIREELRRLASSEGHNLNIILTRETDVNVGLAARGNVARSNNADLFLSIHCNASVNHNARGTETLISPVSDGNTNHVADKSFAQTIQTAVFGAILALDPNARDRGVKDQVLAALRRTATGPNVRSCMVELEFIDFAAADNLLNKEPSATEARGKIAKATAGALVASL